MNKQTTRVDRLLQGMKDNPVTAALIVLGTVVIALASFSGAVKDIFSLVPEQGPSDIGGQWVAQVTYDWQYNREPARYQETFEFDVEGNEVFGTATFLGRKRAIHDGSLKKDLVTFTTKSREYVSGQEREVLHRFRGRSLGDEIRFSLLIEGGYSDHLPIKFTARRLPADNQDQ